MGRFFEALVIVAILVCLTVVVVTILRGDKDKKYLI